MNLDDLAQSEQRWSLDHFVELCNRFLPFYLPDSKGNLKVKEEVNPRLVRHYSSQKLLDEPLREGKYAVYTYRHLLQFLVVRRLLSQGIGAIAINDLIVSKSNQELKALLTGGFQIHLSTAHPSLSNSNSALDFLQSLKEGQINAQKNKDNSLISQPENRTNFSSSLSKLNSNITKNQETNWTRIEVLAGLEIHLRSDFVYPNSVSEQENLKQIILQKLTLLLRREK